MFHAGLERRASFSAKTGLRANKVAKKKPAHPFLNALVRKPKDVGDQPAEAAVAAPVAEQ
jgi:hypothetical protein